MMSERKKKRMVRIFTVVLVVVLAIVVGLGGIIPLFFS